MLTGSATICDSEDLLISWLDWKRMHLPKGHPQRVGERVRCGLKVPGNATTSSATTTPQHGFRFCFLVWLLNRTYLPGVMPSDEDQ